jgi:hypothetical protein
MSSASMAISRTWTDRGEPPPIPAAVVRPSPLAISEIRRASATSSAVTSVPCTGRTVRRTWSRRRSTDSRSAASSPQAATTRAAVTAASTSEPAGRLARSTPRT